MDPTLERRSPLFVRLFQAYSRRYAAPHFHGVRLAHGAPPIPQGPVLVAMNHPSWWDPILAAILAAHVGDRVHAAPIDARALEAYRFFRRLGFFGVEQGTARGWEQLLEGGGRVLSRSDGVLWVTPQGHFTDPRQRPVVLKAGIGSLLHGMKGGTLLPLAIEYPFWTERLPEALALFGPPVAVEDGADASPQEWTLRAARALEDAQDRLAVLSSARDEAAFHTLVDGKAGVNPFYDAWRRTRALFSGQSFRPVHGDLVRPRLEAP